jgi:DNA-binding Lrp family transcriptional regulator
MPIELPARDMKVLQLLCRNGIMTNEQVKQIYGNTSRYYLKRLEKMSRQGYIVRRAGYVSITQKGVQLLGEGNKAVRVKKWNRTQRADLIDIMFELTDWEVKFTTEIKRERGLNRGAIIDGLIKKGETEYAIYILSAESPRPVSIGKLWREINELPAKSYIHRAIVFCPSPKSMGLILAKVKNPLIKKLLLLPQVNGLELFKKYQSNDFDNIVKQRFPEATPAGRNYADYMWQGKYVTILVCNDAIKRYYLKEYYEGLGERLEGKEVIIVCLQGQYGLFSEIYPRAKFAVIDNDMQKFL